MNTTGASVLADAILTAVDAGPIHKMPDEALITSMDEAYRVQDLINACQGGVVAWKVARAPDGVIRCSAIPRARYADAAPVIALSPHFEGKIEFEIGVKFCRTIEAKDLPKNSSDLEKLIGNVFPIIEIVSSRFGEEFQSRQHWQLADHQNCQMVVAQCAPLKGFTLFEPSCLNVTVNGQLRELIVDSARLERIHDCLIWLCEHAVKRGCPITPDDTVITGALLGPEPLCPNETYTLGLNGVRCFATSFGKG